MGSRKRLGMFDHAKYSQPILRNLPESVRNAVRSDVASLLDHKAALTRQRPRKRSEWKGEVNNQIVSLLDHTTALTSKRPRERSDWEGDLSQSQDVVVSNQITSKVEQIQTPKVEQIHQLQQQAKPSLLKEMADRLTNSFPEINLRNNEPLTLDDASYSLVQKALTAAKLRNEAEAATKNKAGTSSNVPFFAQESPFRTLSNQTLSIDDEARNISNVLNGNEQFLDESPTADQDILCQEFVSPQTQRNNNVLGTNVSNRTVTFNLPQADPLASLAEYRDDFESFVEEFSDINANTNNSLFSPAINSVMSMGMGNDVSEPFNFF